MPHTIDLRRLDHLGQLLSAALAAEDWARIGEIDALIRQGLQRLRVTGMQGCTRECQRVGGLLGRHTEHGEGRRAYSLLDSVQGED